MVFPSYDIKNMVSMGPRGWKFAQIWKWNIPSKFEIIPSKPSSSSFFVEARAVVIQWDTWRQQLSKIFGNSKWKIEDQVRIPSHRRPVSSHRTCNTTWTQKTIPNTKRLSTFSYVRISNKMICSKDTTRPCHGPLNQLGHFHWLCFLFSFLFFFLSFLPSSTTLLFFILFVFFFFLFPFPYPN